LSNNGFDLARYLLGKKAGLRPLQQISRLRKTLFTVATTKAVDWSYEKEVRIIVAAGRPLRLNLYMPISPASITAVRCGCRMPGVTKLQVRAALKHPRFAHVRLMQVVLDRSEYALTFNEENSTSG
jgi:hypothetical protein